jgi:uncharacterized coiled-coil protein SlyX
MRYDDPEGLIDDLQKELAAKDARIAELECDVECRQANADAAYAKWCEANARIAELERIINDAQAAPDAVEAAMVSYNQVWYRALRIDASTVGGVRLEAMQAALTVATLNNDARVKELERERDKALIDVMNLRVLLDGFQDDRATDLEARYARIAELKAALNKIVEEGTITTTTRVGDMYDLVTGYEDSQDIHPLAEIARAALQTREKGPV